MKQSSFHELIAWIKLSALTVSLMSIFAIVTVIMNSGQFFKLFNLDRWDMVFLENCSCDLHVECIMDKWLDLDLGHNLSQKIHHE